MLPADHRSSPRSILPLQQVLLFELRRRGLLRDRLIFLYFAAYGLFRFLHEFMRETPEVALGISGYQIIALGLMVTGAVMLLRRKPGGECRDAAAFSD
jgi:prolipoprotein diacylglyceryltransferase